MNQTPTTYTFQRYLSAKRTIDDRSLNHHVWQSLHHALNQLPTDQREVTILEIGGGIGTMVERLLDEGRLPATNYHLLDEQQENIDAAQARLLAHHPLAATPHDATHTFKLAPTYKGAVNRPNTARMWLNLYAHDLYDFLSNAGSLEKIDLLLAHAFLDLIDIPATLPLLTASLRPGTLLYFTINFDGITALEPAIDPALDAHIEKLYHRTMDERITNGKPSGDSHTGRHLFHHMKTANIHTLDAGSSDWVIIPHQGAYPHDEAYFLHFIVNTMHGALRGHPELDDVRFDRWIAQRHAQIEAGELVYIAHQMDYLGQYQP